MEQGGKHATSYAAKVTTAVACTACGAQAVDPCRTRAHRKAAFPHEARCRDYRATLGIDRGRVLPTLVAGAPVPLTPGRDAKAVTCRTCGSIAGVPCAYAVATFGESTARPRGRFHLARRLDAAAA